MKPITNEDVARLGNNNLKIYLKLGELHDLLSTSWCKDAYARTANGEVCGCGDANATQFCLVGGLVRVCAVASTGFNIVDFLQNLLICEGRVSDLLAFNDKSDQQTVLDFIARARDLLLANKTWEV